MIGLSSTRNLIQSRLATKAFGSSATKFVPISQRAMGPGIKHFSVAASKSPKPFLDFEFSTLVEMQQKASQHFAENRLFGTRKGNDYEWITYKEFGVLVDNTRKVLHKLGIGFNGRVALISNNRVEWAAIQFAAMSLGGQMVPMYEAQPEYDWQYIINDCGATVVIAGTQTILDQVKEYPGKVGNVKHLLCLDANSEDSVNYQKYVYNLS